MISSGRSSRFIIQALHSKFLISHFTLFRRSQKVKDLRSSILSKRPQLEALQISELAPWLLVSSTVTCDVTLEETILDRLSEVPSEIAIEIAHTGLQTWDPSYVPAGLLRRAAN